MSKESLNGDESGGAGEATPNSQLDNEVGRRIYKKIHENNYLQNQLIFNI